MGMKRSWWIVIGVAVLAALVVVAVLMRRGPEVSAPPPEAERALYAEGFTGAESCRECHQAIYAQWEKTTHAIAMAPAAPGHVRGDFVQDTTHTFDGQHYEMFTRDGVYYIRTMGPAGKTATYDITYVLGARQHEIYLTRFPDGRYQVLPVYYDLAGKRWYDSAEGTLEIGRALQPEEWLFWANRGRTWNERCFDCHASQMRKNYDAGTNTYGTVVGDLSINCEACHGPGAEHIQFWREAMVDPEVARKGVEPLVDLNKLSGAQQLEVCAQCHALKTVLRSGYEPGDNFWDFYEVSLLDFDDPYWPDGLIRQQTYPYIQFASSRCFRMGGLTCTGCHGAHGGERPVDLITDSGKGGMCGRCHPQIMADVGAHSHHNPGGPGSDCNACHLPELHLSQMSVTDHRIANPAPELTVRLGIPNACNQAGCHADKTAGWASEWSRRWYGDYQDAMVTRAQAVQWGREGDARALPVLLEILNTTDEDALLRGAAAALLGRVGDPSALPALLAAMGDTNQVVRAKTAVALGEIRDPRVIEPLRRALADEVFSVRIRAAFSLASLDYWPAAEADRKAYEAALKEHEEMVLTGLLADNPDALMTLGQTYEFRRDYARAGAAYERALRLNPAHAPSQEHMAQLVETEGRFRKLTEMLRPAVDSDVRAAAVLGMAFADRGRYEEAVSLLGRVGASGARTELVPFGLGEAYRRMGRPDEAQAQYRRALAIWPGFANAHRGLALIAYAQGRDEEGRAHWERFLAGDQKQEQERRVQRFVEPGP